MGEGFGLTFCRTIAGDLQSAYPRGLNILQHNPAQFDITA